MVFMRKIITLKKNYEFSRIYKKGKYCSASYLVLYVMPYRDSESKRIGITVSRKIGKSVVRNRIRRLIKESYRQVEQSVKNGYDLVFVARKSERIPEYKEICKEIKYLLKRSGLFIRENGN